MKRFTVILMIVGGGCLLGGVLFLVLPFDPLGLQGVLTSDGAFDQLAVYAFGEIEKGLIYAGLLLIILGLFLFLVDGGRIRLFDWPLRSFLLFILSLQIVLGIIYIASISYVPAADFEWYHRQATNLAQGRSVSTIWGQPTAFWPIGYPMVLSVFYRIFGSKLIVAQILNIIFSCGIILFAFLLGREVFTEKIARCAALLLAFLPSQIFYVIMPMADTPFSLSVLVLLYLTLKKMTYINAILTGVVFGIAALMKPVILFFPLFLFCIRIVRRKKWRPALVHLVLILAIGEAIMLPWQIRNYKTFGSFVLVSNNGGYNMWMGNNENASGGVLPFSAYIPRDTLLWMKSLDEAERDQYSMQQAIKFMKSHPVQATSLAVKKIIHLYFKDSKCVTYGLHDSYEQVPSAILMSMIALTEGYYYSLGIAFLISLYFLLKREKVSTRTFLIVGTILYFTLIYLPFIAEGRFHMPLLPLFAIVACVPRSYYDRRSVKAEIR